MDINMLLDNRTTVLFDLDGTLLPFEQRTFIKSYFGQLIRKAVPLGFDKDRLIQGLWDGTDAMVANDGKQLNCDLFWDLFVPHMGRSRAELEPIFNEYYATEFDLAQDCLTARPDHRPLLQSIRDRGCGVVLATNPLFPPVAVETRLGWVGLTASDFDHITTYENSRYCKPNPDYYRALLCDIGKHPQECVMVGNNAREDMVAGTLGLATFLVTEHLENPENADITQFRHGSFADLEAWLLA